MRNENSSSPPPSLAGAPSRVADREKRPLFETTKASLSTKGGKTEPRRRPPASKGNTIASSIESRPLIFNFAMILLSLSLSQRSALSLKVVVVVGKRRRRPPPLSLPCVAVVALFSTKSKANTNTTTDDENRKSNAFGGFFETFFLSLF